MGKGLPCQVLGHGLGPDVKGRGCSAERRVPGNSAIEGPQVHRKDVIFRKSWFLKKKKMRPTQV